MKPRSVNIRGSGFSFVQSMISTEEMAISRNMMALCAAGVAGADPRVTNIGD